jgi:TldD protein
LEPNQLDDAVLTSTLARLQVKSSDFSDLYFERTTRQSWRIEDQRVTSGNYSDFQGVGVRVVESGKSALSYSSDLSPRALAAAADAANDMRRGGADASLVGGVPAFRAETGGRNLFPASEVIGELDSAKKVSLLQRIDRISRAVDIRIKRVTAHLILVDSVILVASGNGTLAADIRPLMKMYLSVVAESNGRVAHGNAGLGGRHSLSDLDEDKITTMVRRATSESLQGLEARPAPAGEMSVVLGPGFPGVLLHEAVGHGLEGDSHTRRASAFSEYMNQIIAAAGVTVVDDGTLPGMPGSLHVDDEGTATERTVLIENGKLTGLMQDRMNARLMNSMSTGNARRESYTCLPMVRMTNTFMEAGAYDPREVIGSVKNGIYAAEFGGGTVDVVSGRFNFSATQAFLIEDGRITAPVSGATLIGVGYEVLRNISMVGSDLALDEGEAVCGKQGQSVFVGVGQPTLRIDRMIVGGAG